jgi:phage tail-like protein
MDKVMAMGTTSSYLRYLPPVLWQGDPGTPGFSLGGALRIFEKVLTGIEDGVSLTHRPRNGNEPTAAADEHDHPALAAEIAQLHQLFNPWTTKSEFLPWLASWVALEFPTLQALPLWDDYQRRKVTAEIAQIHRLRGRRAGLNRFLELYALGRTRPRVALDDGTRVLELTPSAGAITTATGLVTQGPVLQDRGVWSEGVTRPWAVTTATEAGDVFVGDTGAPPGVPVPLPSRVWHLDAAGSRDLSGAPPKPRPLAPDTLALSRVVSLAVRAATGGGRPETLYVLDRAGRLYSVPAPWATASATLLTSIAAPGTTIWPVAMAVDPPTGDLLVLDRGDGPGTPNPPKVIAVQPTPLAVTRTNLSNVVEPLSLAVERDGALLVGDGGDQDPPGPSGYPGNLLRVDRAGGWTQTPLLPASNPLVAPAGIARTRDGRLFVLDAGLKPFSPSATDPFICAVAEPAAVYEVRLTAPAPTLVRISEPGQLVYPTGMAAAGDRLLICDPGQPEVAGLQPFWSRVRPFMFDVVIHFAASRLPPDPRERQQVLNQSVGSIRAIIEAQKPAHSVWNLITAI